MQCEFFKNDWLSKHLSLKCTNSFKVMHYTIGGSVATDSISLKWSCFLTFFWCVTLMSVLTCAPLYRVACTLTTRRRNRQSCESLSPPSPGKLGCPGRTCCWSRETLGVMFYSTSFFSFNGLTITLCHSLEIIKVRVEVFDCNMLSINCITSYGQQT